MNKKIYFENMSEKLHKLLKIYPDVFVKQDNRLKNNCATIQHYIYNDTKEDCYLLRYNAKELKLYPKWQLIRVIFHELAHVILGHCKGHFAPTKVDQEYNAEKLALLWIKRYYPNYYQRSVNYLKKYEKHNVAVYKKAYMKLWKELNA